MSSHAVKLSPFITFKYALVTEILHETMLHYLPQMLQQYCSDSSGRNMQELKKHCPNSFGCNTSSDKKEFANTNCEKLVQYEN